jgi:hypothetical protein
MTDKDKSDAQERHASDGRAPCQRELAEKALRMKRAAEDAAHGITEEGAPLHPDDPDASDGKADLARTERRTAPSGALDHAGELPSRERLRTRY